MRRVELARLFTGVGCKVTDEVFIDEAKNIIVLLAIRRNILNQLNQFADHFSLIAGAVTEFAQTSFQCVENFAEHLFLILANKATSLSDRNL